jgi:hypothetical protein
MRLAGNARTVLLGRATRVKYRLPVRAAYGPHPGPLPGGEGDDRQAAGWDVVAILTMRTQLNPVDPYLPQFGCLLLVLALCGLCLLPLVAIQVMEEALRKLHLPGAVASLTVAGIVISGLMAAFFT